MRQRTSIIDNHHQCGQLALLVEAKDCAYLIIGQRPKMHEVRVTPAHQVLLRFGMRELNWLEWDHAASTSATVC